MDGASRTRYLTVNEVAEIMRVSRMTVYRLLHSGEMAGIRVGRSFRVPAASLDAFLAANNVIIDDSDAGQAEVS